MPSISMFLACDSVGNITLQPGISSPQLTGPRSVLRPQYIPGAFSFGLAVGIIGVDTNVQNIARFKITNPGGTVIHDSGDSVFPPIGINDPMPKEYQGFMLTLDIRNLPIEEEGVYTISLFINGANIGSMGIPVFRAIQ